MAQSKPVAALRMRLIRKGYMDVQIYQTEAGTYMIKAREPLAGFGVQLEVKPEDVPITGMW